MFKRKSCEFLVKFADGEEIWLPWSKDLADTIQFERFCLSKSYLFPLTISAKDWNHKMMQMNKAGIDSVKPGVKFFLNLRYFGDGYYQSLDLPEKDRVDYVVECFYSSWRVKGRAINVKCSLFDQTYIWNAAMVFLHGCQFAITPEMRIVDEELTRRFPAIMKG